jgi:hypothetical protein
MIRSSGKSKTTNVARDIFNVNGTESPTFSKSKLNFDRTHYFSPYVCSGISIVSLFCMADIVVL